MRQFIVLGCKTNAQTDPGKIILQTTDCAKAKDAVNAPTDRYARKELHELAMPMIRKQHATAEQIAAAEQAEAKELKAAKTEKKTASVE